MSWACLAVGTTFDWGAWLAPIVAAVIAGVGGAYIAGRMAARRMARQFRSEQSWQQRMKIYTDVLSRLNRVWETCIDTVKAIARGTGGQDVKEETAEDFRAIHTRLRDCGPVFDPYVRRRLATCVDEAQQAVELIPRYLANSEIASAVVAAVKYEATRHQIVIELFAAQDLQIESSFLRSRRTRASYRKMILRELMTSIDEGDGLLRKADEAVQRGKAGKVNWPVIGTGTAKMLAKVYAHRIIHVRHITGKRFLGGGAVRAINDLIRTGTDAMNELGPHSVTEVGKVLPWWEPKKDYNGVEHGPTWLRVTLPAVDEAHHRIDWLINGLPIWQHCKACVVPPWRALKAAWRDAWYELMKWD